MNYILFGLGVMLYFAVLLLIWSMCWMSAIGSRKQDWTFSADSSQQSAISTGIPKL